MTTDNAGGTRRGSEFFQPDKVSNMRALICYAIGVAAGLILGGIGLFNARGTTTNRVPQEDAALVNQRPILRSDLATQLENEMGHPFEQATREEKLKVLDEMLREELFVQRGLELDFAETDQDTRYALYSIVEQQITANAAIGEDKEEDVRKYFDAHRDKFLSDGEIDAHHLILAGQDAQKASDAAKALRDGAALDEVVQRFGLTVADYNGPEPYYLAAVHLGEDLFAQAKELDTGDVSEPWPEDDGYHIVQIVENTKPSPLTFEQAQTKAEIAYADTKQARVIDNAVKFLRNRSTILIADDFQDYDPDRFTSDQ